MLELILNPVGHISPTITIAVVIVGMVVLAAFDVWRQEVEDYAVVALLATAVTGLAAEGVSATQWLSGILVAAVAFALYLSLGMRGVMGGGDVKLSVVPALVLGAANPFLGLWWICCAIVLQQLLAGIIGRALRPAGHDAASTPVALPHVPAMAGALIATTVAFAPLI